MISSTQSGLSRNFLPQDFTVHSWDELLPYFDELKDREITSAEELEKWLKDKSELEAALQEDMGWRYIRQTCDTANEEKKESLLFFIRNIEPHLAEYSNIFNEKLLHNKFIQDLDEQKYFVYLRSIKKETELFRSENIPLLTEVQALSNEYGQITGAMSVEVDGKTLTFQQASNYLKLPERDKRKEVYISINQRRCLDQDKLDDLFDKLLSLRHSISLNAGYQNFRDYMFDALGRFDYKPENCFDFHSSVHKFIVPIIENFERSRKNRLGYENLYPWDLEVDPDLLPPLKPFSDGKSLIEKSALCFERVKPAYGDLIRLMDRKGHLDLESRIGKAPGGYNYPLYESALPFIFMNAAGSIRDMVTMMHEGGHAIHSWVTKDLELTGFKHTPSEIAEVASMAMELISMEHWDVFFPDKAELKRARLYQLEKILGILPWIAIVDAFQHWIYLNPNHTRQERQDQWISLHRKYSGGIVDRSLYPEFEANGWHRQLHIFEVPFYYIEYGIAQLGAIGIWRNYKSDPAGALEKYEQALSCGNLKTLPELYEAAGIHFDFSGEYVQELSEFVKKEIEILQG